MNLTSNELDLLVPCKRTAQSRSLASIDPSSWNKLSSFVHHLSISASFIFSKPASSHGPYYITLPYITQLHLVAFKTASYRSWRDKADRRSLSVSL